MLTTDEMCDRLVVKMNNMHDAIKAVCQAKEVDVSAKYLKAEALMTAYDKAASDLINLLRLKQEYEGL